ncbi:DNA polymerase III subunit delta' [Croceicoccus hydrothermalis]|uniref:DNA polymerase III subunit delta' n=1 Tax=Croceicoccus hydrothermalis TaxID=2867964 RepID=UPI001EFB9FCD|nr:DNA polymerase III subunit delta' [Croceicoccus hydrothermalis]
MTTLVGHETPWRQWRAAVADERLHHAWLLTGMAGIGKAQFAVHAAAALVEVDGTPQPPATSHPDILILTRPPASKDDEKKMEEGKPFATKRSINVEQVRAMQRRLNTRPTLGPRRAIIIDSIDDLEKSAVNALLKSLEEPPAGTVFLLVSHRPGGLLPTVRSRCRILRFTALDNAQMHQVVGDAAPDVSPDIREAAIAAAHGSPGAALGFIAKDMAPIRHELIGIAAHGDTDFARRGALAKAIGTRPDRDRLVASVDLARTICAARMHDATRGEQARLITAHAALTRLGAEIPYANFDPGLTVVEIGGLLADIAMPKGEGN